MRFDVQGNAPSFGSFRMLSISRAASSSSSSPQPTCSVAHSYPSPASLFGQSDCASSGAFTRPLAGNSKLQRAAHRKLLVGPCLGELHSVEAGVAKAPPSAAANRLAEHSKSRGNESSAIKFM